MTKIETGEYLGIKWELSELRPEFYQNERFDVFCRIYSEIQVPKSKFLYNNCIKRLYLVNPKDSNLKQVIFDEIDRIHQHILLQYELGGLKYLESQNKIHLLSEQLCH